MSEFLKRVIDDSPKGLIESLEFIATQILKIENKDFSKKELSQIHAFLIDILQKNNVVLENTYNIDSEDLASLERDDAGRGHLLSTIFIICLRILGNIDKLYIKEAQSGIQEMGDYYQDRQRSKIESEGLSGIAVLTKEEKEFIHQKLNSIREQIENSDLDDAKRNELLKRISELARDVDLAGTPTSRFLDSIVTFTIAIRKGHENLKPLLGDLKDACRTVLNSRAKNEGLSLSKGEDLFQLPNPETKTK